MKKNELNKQQIVATLREYCDRYDSQNKASEALKISSATVSRILAGKWDLITNEMWRNIAAQIGVNERGWQAVETATYGDLKEFYEDAKAHSLVMAVTCASGSGKTFTARQFGNQNSDVFVLYCNGYWKQKDFLSELLRVMGRNHYGLTVSEMVREVVLIFRKIDRPLLIMDEADKLSDPVARFFITLYNELEYECGIILQATNHLEKRLKSGLERNGQGYNEIWSRVKRRCVAIKGVRADDIAGVCMANGIKDMDEIDDIIKDSEGDLRRVRHLVHAIKRKNSKKKK